MRICFVSKGSLNAFSKRRVELTEVGADVIVFGFNGLGEVSYEKELKGETHYFEEAAALSKRTKAVTVCGCVTDTRGHKRRSVVVAENGKITGVSDMLNVVDGEVSCGATLRVYETKAGKMGVIVAEDLLFPEVAKSLAVCGSDFIVCPYLKLDELQSVLLRATAYFYGVPIFFCCDGYAMVAEASGRISFASPQSPVCAEFKPVKEYHLVETRRRGFYRPKRTPI